MRTHDKIWEGRTYVLIAKNLGYLATDVWVKGRYNSSKYFHIVVRKMNWSINRMEYRIGTITTKRNYCYPHRSPHLPYYQD